MKIAIFSDTHDNAPNFIKALDWVKNQGIEIILHCGDVSRPYTLEKVVLHLEGKMIGVLGNTDTADLKEYQHFPKIIFKEGIAEEKIGGKKIAFTHFPDKAKELAKKGKYDVVFHGHTHKPWEEKIGETLVLNPGTLAGLYYKATFAVYDTETGDRELKILEKL